MGTIVEAGGVMAAEHMSILIDLEELMTLLIARFEEQPLLLLAHLTIGTGTT